ncbi:hypothetical protein [Ferrimonas futtsuensis]|uniref:hypothetical protein n=1 Tax=Ferrimonas futtsuensis TaxID=364764 RepID=UPI0003FA30B3|nr:hypothetical protein [Ferrimonas futtsuensis]
MKITPGKIELCLLLAASLPAVAEPLPTAPFTAHYQASSQGVPCGQGTQSLKLEGQQALLEGSGDFCLFGDANNLTRMSWFNERWNTDSFASQVKGWFPVEYRGKPGAQGTMEVLEDGELIDYPDTMTPAIQGAATMLQNLPLLAKPGQDVVTSYTWGDETRHYRFENLGLTTLPLMDRSVTTLHLRQTHPRKSRVADFWFAPELGNQLVRLEVRRLGILVLEVELTQFQSLPMPIARQQNH